MRKKLMLGLAVLPLALAAKPFDLGQALTDMSCQEFQFRLELDPTHLGLKELIPNPHLADMALRALGKGCSHPLWQNLDDLLSLRYFKPTDFADGEGREGVTTVKNLISYLRGPTIPADITTLVNSLSPGNDVVKGLLEARSPTRRPADLPLHVLERYFDDRRLTMENVPEFYEVALLRKRPYDRKRSSTILLELMEWVAEEKLARLVPLHPDPDDMDEMAAVNLLLEKSKKFATHNLQYFLAHSEEAAKHCEDLCNDDRPQACHACYQNHSLSDNADLVERAGDYLAKACKKDSVYCPESRGFEDTGFVLKRLLHVIQNEAEPDARYTELQKSVSGVPVRELHIVLNSLGFSFDNYSRVSTFVEGGSHLHLALEEIEAFRNFEDSMSVDEGLADLVHFVLKLFSKEPYSRFVRENKLLTQKVLQRMVLGLQTPSLIPEASLDEIFPDATSRTNWNAESAQDKVVKVVKLIKDQMNDTLKRLLNYELLRQPNNDSLQQLALCDLVQSTSQKAESVPVTWFYRKIEKKQVKRQFAHDWSDDFMTKVIEPIKRLAQHREYWSNVVALAIADDFGVAQSALSKALGPGKTFEQYADGPSAPALLLKHGNHRNCSECDAHCRCEKYKKLGLVACYVAGYLGYLWQSKGIAGAVDFALYCDAYSTAENNVESQRLQMATWQAVYRTIGEGTLSDAVSNTPAGVEAALVAIPYTSALWKQYPAVLESSPKFSSFVTYVKNFIVENCTKDYPYLLNAYTRFEAPTVASKEQPEFDKIKKMMEEFTVILKDHTKKDSGYQELRVRLYDAFFGGETGVYHPNFTGQFTKATWDDAITGIAAHILQRVKEEVGEKDPDTSTNVRICRAMQLLLTIATAEDWNLFMSLTKNDATGIRSKVMRAVPNKEVWLKIYEAAGLENLEKLLLQTSTYLPQLAALCEALQGKFNASPLDTYKITEESAASTTPRKVFRLLAAIHNDSEPSCIPPRYTAFKKVLSDGLFSQSSNNVSAILEEGWKDQFEAWSKPTMRTFHAAGLELLIDQYFASWEGDASKREASRKAFGPLTDATMKIALDYDQGRVNLGESFQDALQRYALDLMSADHDKEGGLFSKDTRELVDLALLYNDRVSNTLKTYLVSLLQPMMNALGAFFGSDAATSLIQLKSAAQELHLDAASGKDQETVNNVIKTAFLLTPDSDGLKSFDDSEKIITVSGAQIGTPQVLDPCPLNLRAGPKIPCGSQLVGASSPTGGPPPPGGGPPPPPPPPPGVGPPPPPPPPPPPV